jgi:hypothetical protein
VGHGDSLTEEAGEEGQARGHNGFDVEVERLKLEVRTLNFESRKTGEASFPGSQFCVLTSNF